MIQGMVSLLPAPERGVGLVKEIETSVNRGLRIMMIRKPTEWVPPFSELFTDALIECFLAWCTTRAVAVLNSWALLGVAEALIRIVPCRPICTTDFTVSVQQVGIDVSGT